LAAADGAPVVCRDPPDEGDDVLDTTASDLMFRPVTELAGLVRSGDVSARELVEASLERIEALQPEVNAFTYVDAEGALAAADAIGPGDERPFAGVPLGIKDLRPVRGLPLTYGTELAGDYRPEYDAHVVRRFREAGFVVVGITNMPELGIIPVTEPRRYGPTRNPWNPERTPGGSSGGSAAAVASGMVPIAHATDGGGSTRIPAACCGLVGLKTSRGRISLGPDLGDHFTTVDGVLTRTVAETASLLDVLAGYELGDATWAPPPAEPFAATAAREPARLRIALALEPPLEADVDPVCIAAARDAAELLTSLGHEVDEVTPPWRIPGLLDIFTMHFAGSIALGIGHAAALGGREPTREAMEPLSWEMWQRGNSSSALAYVTAMAQLQAFARGLISFFAGHDAVLTPALGERPVPLGEIDSCSEDPMADFRRSGVFTPYTAMANVTGQPAISLPLFHGEDGLPLAIQLIGRPAGEGELLALAAQVEAARPWSERRPDLAA
jgi:amidase